jgi:hypothetical protein
MFWHRVRLSSSIRGSLVANTPITGIFGVALRIAGNLVASPRRAMHALLSIYDLRFVIYDLGAAPARAEIINHQSSIINHQS